MQSIIEEIALAEARADEVRNLASASARERIAQANEQANERLSALDKSEREKTRDALTQAERDGEAEAERMRADMEKETDALCAAAEKRIAEASDYLLKKVQSIA